MQSNPLVDEYITKLQDKAEKNLNSDNLTVLLSEKQRLDNSHIGVVEYAHERYSILQRLYLDLWREQQKNASQEEIGAWMKRVFGTNYIESFSEEEFIEWRNKL